MTPISRNIALTLLPAAALATACAPSTTSSTTAAPAPVVSASNPLFVESTLPYHAPRFDLIRNEHYQPAIEEGIRLQLAEIDAVVINLGTNDFNPGDPGNAYTMALGTFVDTVRGRYPDAWIFCAVGTMYNASQHAKALSYAQSAVAARGGDTGKVAAIDLGSQDALQGTGCDWHPSAAEDQRMADILVPILRQKLGW